MITVTDTDSADDLALLANTPAQAGLGCRIRRLLLCQGVRLFPKSVLDITLNNLMVMLEFGGMRSTPSLPLLPGPLWLGVVAPDRVIPMGQIELFDIWTECKLMTYTKLNCLK